MDHASTVEQAKSVASLLPALMRQMFAIDDDPAGELSLAQLRVCGSLREGPRAMSALSRQLGVTLSAMTQIADRLERAGVVQRVARGSDRRIRCLQLTAHGQSMLHRRDETRVRNVSAVLERLTPDDRDQVLSALETLVDACAGTEPPRAVFDGESPVTAAATSNAT